MRRNKQQFSKNTNPKREVMLRLAEIQVVLKGYQGGCLFPGNGEGGLCTEPPSRRHVIPRRPVLDKLKGEQDGKVLEFDWDVGNWSHLLLSSDEDHPFDLDDPETFEPRGVGTHDACTGLFACQCHDDVFNPSLDTDTPDFGNPHVRMLAVARAMLYAADQASRRKFLVDKFHTRHINSPNKRLRMRWAQEWEQANANHRLAHSVTEQWRDIWRSTDKKAELPDLVDWCSLTFRSTLTFAACVFYGQAVALMVLPGDGEHHKMKTLYFREDSGKVKEHKERLTQKARDTEEADAYGVSMIDELMSRGNGVVAASPASYKALRDEDRLAIQQIIMEKLRFWGGFADP